MPLFLIFPPVLQHMWIQPVHFCSIITQVAHKTERTRAILLNYWYCPHIVHLWSVTFAFLQGKLTQEVQNNARPFKNSFLEKPKDSFLSKSPQSYNTQTDHSAPTVGSSAGEEVIGFWHPQWLQILSQTTHPQSTLSTLGTADKKVTLMLELGLSSFKRYCSNPRMIMFGVRHLSCMQLTLLLSLAQYMVPRAGLGVISWTQSQE